MNQNIAYEVAKIPDLEVLSCIQNAAKSSNFTVDSANFTLHCGGDPIQCNGTEWNENAELDIVFRQQTELISNFHFTLKIDNAHLQVQLNRNRNQLRDSLAVVLTNPNQKLSRPIVLVLLSSLRKEFTPIDSRKFADNVLGDILHTHYEAREAEFSKIEGISTALIRDQDIHRQNLEKQFDRRREELESEHAKKLELLKGRELELEKRLKEIDDRESKHVRRDLRNKLKESLKDRYQKFELSQGTVNLRRPIFWFTVFLLTFFGVGFIYTLGLSLGFIKSSGQVDQLLLNIKQAAFAIAFGSTAYFFINWQNSWFDRHAREEFQLKRLDIDFDRASWAVELASEWIEEKEKDIPPQLLDRITNNLFINSDANTNEALHPADHLASAIFGSSAEMNLKLPNGVEAKLDRKSIRDLKKGD